MSVGARVNLLRAWGRILQGRSPTLSIEITRECPLHCPGCYAYEPEHLGGAGPLRELGDYRGQELIDRFLGLVREKRPVYISIVGGEPLVRWRELDVILPELSRMGHPVQLVTSAVRRIPPAWGKIPGLFLCVSIDGLQPEHDARRAPATYERILSTIEGHSITVHCTVTGQMARQPGAFETFLEFWSSRPEVWRIWFSLFTPQVGAQGEEILSAAEREETLDQLERLRDYWPKLELRRELVRGFRRPPSNPEECLFARTTTCVSADLRTAITPCQFGGNPDCTQCGCMASAGLKVVGEMRVAGLLPIRALYDASAWIGGLSRTRPLPPAAGRLDPPARPRAT